MNAPYVRFTNSSGDEVELTIYMKNHNKYNFKNILKKLITESYTEIEHFDLMYSKPKEYFPFVFNMDRQLIYSKNDFDGLYVFDYPKLKFRNGIVQKDGTICI